IAGAPLNLAYQRVCRDNSMTTASLFDAEPLRGTQSIGTQAVVLRAYALEQIEELLHALRCILKNAPFRPVITPGGHEMSVRLSACGELGWVSDVSGYRYSAINTGNGL